MDLIEPPEKSFTTEPVFADTNLLVYARDASDPDKQGVAVAWMEHLWMSAAGRLSVQVLQEYYVTVTRKLRPGLPQEEARADVRDLIAWRPIRIDEAIVDAAWRVEDRYGLSFWDSLIVSAAQQAGCAAILTEDLQHELDIDGLLVADPFRTPVGSLS